MDLSNQNINKNLPLVSVTIPCYNQEEFIERSVNSVLNQTYKNIEIIIVDDFSTKDRSREIIKQLESNNPGKIKCIFQTKNVGIPTNKNTGFRASNGDLLTYLDADDFYYPEKIEKEVEIFIKHPETDVVYSNFNFTEENGEFNRVWSKEKLPSGDLFEKIVLRDFPQDSVYRCELMKKEILQKINFLDESLKTFEDWDSRIRYSQFTNIKYCDNVGLAYVINSKGISRSKRSTIFNNMRKVYDNNEKLIKNKLSNRKLKKIEKKFELQKIWISYYTPDHRNLFKYSLKYFLNYRTYDGFKWLLISIKIKLLAK